MRRTINTTNNTFSRIIRNQQTQAIRVFTSAQTIEVFTTKSLSNGHFQGFQFGINDLDDRTFTHVLIFFLLRHNDSTSNTREAISDLSQFFRLVDRQFIIVRIRRDIRVTTNNQRIRDFMTTIFKDDPFLFHQEARQNRSTQLSKDQLFPHIRSFKCRAQYRVNSTH